jgi:hypothetical protein
MELPAFVTALYASVIQRLPSGPVTILGVAGDVDDRARREGGELAQGRSALTGAIVSKPADGRNCARN